MIPSPQSVIRSPWLYDVSPFRIVDNIYYVGNKSVSSHLFDTGEGLLLLDTTYGQTTYLLLESIRELGFDPHDLRWIVHSHGHIDHFGATRYLVEKYGSKTYMPRPDLDFLTDRAHLNWCEEFNMLYEPPYDYYFAVDKEIDAGDVLQFGNTKMLAYSAAGHTPGTMAYVFELPGGLRAAMHGGIGLNTISAQYSKMHGLGSEWREAYGRSLTALRDLEVDVVLGNHPGPIDLFTKAEQKSEAYNPFVDPTYWKRFLEETHAKYLKFIESDPMDSDE